MPDYVALRAERAQELGKMLRLMDRMLVDNATKRFTPENDAIIYHQHQMARIDREYNTFVEYSR